MSALERLLGDFAGAVPAPAPRQAAAAAALREGSLPTRHDENWHYAQLRALEALPGFVPAAAGAPAGTGLPAALTALEPLPGHVRLALWNGRLLPGSLPAAADPGVPQRLATAAASDAWPASEFELRGDGRFGWLPQLFGAEFVALRATGRQALEIVYGAGGQAPASYADVAIEIAPGAELDLVERQLGAPGADAAAWFGCHRLRVRIGSGARLRHTRLQRAGATELLLDTSSVVLDAGAHYDLREINAGAGSARHTLQATLIGADAAVQVHSLSAARAGQRSDAHYTILHEAPRTRSDVLFRGSASDRAHVACSADVRVAGRAPGARVQQSLRGLLDGKGAEIDLRPRLTIDTDQVQANHGATTGQLDDERLFYLLARGMDPEAARALLKWAFLSEALGAVEPPVLRREAGRAIVARLAEAPSEELLQ
jgi:Fe-S cluster assembly protein SufD